VPPFFDQGIGNPVLHRRRVCCLRLEDCWRGNDVQLIALPGLTVVRSPCGRGVKRKLNLLDVLIGLSGYILNRRPEVADHIVVGDNVRDVPGLTDDLNVSLRGHNVSRVAGLAPVRIADKSIGCRSNAIIRVGPGRYRLLRGDVCFGWKRSPANVFITFPPGDPGRSPLIAGDPAPAGPSEIDPSAIVVGCPAKALVGVPVPAAICPNPVSVSVRSPVFGHPWSETVTIVAGLDPIALLGG
jgi:hypothetical protein